MVPMKYLSNFWRTLEMSVEMVCKLFFFVGDQVNQVPTFTITDTKLYGPVVTLSTQDNAKLLQRLKSGFKRTVC